MSTAHLCHNEPAAYLAMFPGMQPRILTRGNQGPLLPAMLRANSPGYQASKLWIKRRPWHKSLHFSAPEAGNDSEEGKTQLAKKDQVRPWLPGAGRSPERNIRPHTGASDLIYPYGRKMG